MKVNIVSISQPTIEGMKTPGEFIAYAARVSNPANQHNTLTSSRLLKYLINNKHWSPFEMVTVCMEIETTRDIARQILRHRSFSFQEFSQRYADPTGDLGFVIRETRLQDNNNRQNSIEISESDHEYVHNQWQAYQRSIIDYVSDAYRWAMSNNIAKEQARVILPEGLTVSRMYMSGTLRSWIHYCMLRCSNGTQKEHREVAKACWENIISSFPELKDIDIYQDEKEQLLNEIKELQNQISILQNKLDELSGVV